MSKIKKRLYVRKLIQQQQGVDLNQSIQTIESQCCGNIFQNTSIDPMFETKSKLQKRNIVGKPEIFRKVQSTLESQIKFMQPLNANIAGKRIRNKIGDQSASSSSRRRPQESGKDNTKLSFNVVDTLDLLKRMKKTTELIRVNEINRIKQLDKLKISEKIIETHDERVMKKFDEQLKSWNKINSSLELKKKHSTLFNQQKSYRKRIESLELFQSLQPEDQRKPALSWHLHLREPYISVAEIRKQDDARFQLKHQLLQIIPPKKLLKINNTVKAVNGGLDEDDNILVQGGSILHKEIEMLSDIQQQYYLYQ